jgi:hypothetical protein
MRLTESPETSVTIVLSNNSKQNQAERETISNLGRPLTVSGDLVVDLYTVATVKVKVKQSRYRPGVIQSVPGR